MLKRVFAVFIVFILFATVTGTVSAHESNLRLPRSITSETIKSKSIGQHVVLIDKTPFVSYRGMRPEQKPAIAIFFEEVTDLPMKTPEGNSLAAVNSCKSYVKGVRMYSFAGILLYTYQWTIEWCYDGTKVTYLWKQRYVSSVMGWVFNRDIYEEAVGGVGQTSYRHYAQGQFCFLEVWQCVISQTPYVEQLVRGDGTHWGGAGY